MPRFSGPPSVNPLAATQATGNTRKSQSEVAQVAHGDVVTADRRDLPPGFVVTASGRISGVTEPGVVSVDYPFPAKDLAALDSALVHASRASQARFAIYLGDLGKDTAAQARAILAKVPTANDAVLIAVSPNQSAIEIVYGSHLRGRGAEEAAPRAVAAAAAEFEQDNLTVGLLSAIRVLSTGIVPA